MFKFDLEDYYLPCKTKAQLIEAGVSIIEESDGSVRLYNPNNKQLTVYNNKPCCELLGYTFDVVNHKCIWSSNNQLTQDEFKIILNPQGNDSVIFSVDENEECCLDISFDYLFKFDCNDLGQSIKTRTTNTGSDIGTNFTEEIKIIDDKISKYSQLIEYEEGRNVPYVIECEESSPWSPGSGTWTWYREKSRPTPEYWRDLSKKNTYKSAFFKRPSSNDNNRPEDQTLGDPDTTTPPLSWSWSWYATTIDIKKKFCLTDEGEAQWKLILGEAKYNEWVLSNGTDTTLYDCDDLKALEKLQKGSDIMLYDENCDWSITDRQESESKINIYTTRIEDCKKQKETLIEISEIETPGTTEIIEAPCKSFIDFFENFNVCFTIEKLNTTTGRLETIYEETLFNIGSGNFWDYISNANGATGILISGNTGIMPTFEQGYTSPTPPLAFAFDLEDYATTYRACRGVRDGLVKEIWESLSDEERRELKEGGDPRGPLTNWYQSCWLSYSKTICDQDIISQIKNEKINISLKVKNACADFSVMLDRIKLNKKCTKVNNIETFISEPPKFEITKLIDNKKSWISNKVRDDRDFVELKYRETEYNTNHHKLVINTKEVDLNLSPARAVEQDVWCFINESNILSCPSGNTNTDCYYSTTAECPTYSATCDLEIITYTLPLPDYSLLKTNSSIPTCEILESLSACGDSEDISNEYRTARDEYSKDVAQIADATLFGFTEGDWENLSVNNDLTATTQILTGKTSNAASGTPYEDFPIMYGFNSGDITNINYHAWMAAYEYTEFTEIVCSGLSLSDIFGSSTDFTYKDAVDDLVTLTGSTSGVSGDIRGVRPYSAATYYFWNVLTNSWEANESGSCLADAVSDFLTLRRSYYIAARKAKEELKLSLGAFLWSNLFIPEFQANKYLI